MIYLWHSEEGVPFNKEKEKQEELGEKLALAVAREEPQLLQPKSRHSLSSGFVGERFFQHAVHVDGSGFRATVTVFSLRFEPVLKGGNLVFLPEEDGVASFMKVVLPDQRPFMMVIFPDREAGIVRVVDLVYSYPTYPREERVPLAALFSRN